MKPFFSSLAIAFSMYSAIPMPRVDWDKKNMRYTMAWFPLVGAVVGAVVFGWLWLAARLGIGASLTAAVATALPVALTGGIHLDGFCDTADALASHAPTERKLEILKDSHIGAFALIACCLYFLLTFGLWSSFVFSPRSAAVLSLGFVFSRALSGIAVVSLRCAKTSGSAAMFADAAQKVRVHILLLCWVWVAAALMLRLSLAAGAFCLLAALLTFFYYKWMAYRRFGGITGDLAGWFLQLCELSVLAAMVICGGVL